MLENHLWSKDKMVRGTRSTVGAVFEDGEWNGVGVFFEFLWVEHFKLKGTSHNSEELKQGDMSVGPGGLSATDQSGIEICPQVKGLTLTKLPGFCI